MSSSAKDTLRTVLPRDEVAAAIDNAQAAMLAWATLHERHAPPLVQAMMLALFQEDIVRSSKS